MRFLAYLFLVVGSSFLLLNLTAIWEPYEYDWLTTTMGLLMVLIGAIVKAGLNLHDEEERTKGHVTPTTSEFDETGRRFPGSFGGRDE